MINNILLNGKIVNLEEEIKDGLHNMIITRVWFEGNNVKLTNESFPFNEEQYNLVKKEVYENAVKFVSLMAERENDLEEELIVEEPVIEEPVVEETLFERLLRETKAGTIWVVRAMEATNDDYEASLQYLFEKGLYNKPQQVVVSKAEKLVEQVKDETVFDRLLRETKAGTIGVMRAMEAANGDYIESLRYLADRGFYDASKLPIKEEKPIVAKVEQEVVAEPIVLKAEQQVANEPIIELDNEKAVVIDAEVKPTKNKMYSKLVKYGLVAVILVGGFTLTKELLGNKKVDSTNDPKTEEIVEQKVVEHNISSTEFLSKSVEIADYLTDKGLETSVSEVYSTLYLSNMTYFDQSAIDELTDNELKILSKSSKTMIEDSLGLLAEIDTFNNKIVEKAGNMSESELASKLISLDKFILSNQNDKDNLNHMENNLVKIVTLSESDEKAIKYLDVLDYFSGSITTSFPHTSSDGSIGGRYLQKTVGSQINEYSRAFMDSSALNSFEVPITDLTNEIGYLSDCGFEFNSFTK